ncbi:hypothetical protein NPIL_230361, partial [Nephila pilipes]
HAPILFHDNTLYYVAQPTVRKLNELGCEILSHPPYYPDLSPMGYN